MTGKVERWLTIAEMAAISGFSKSFFYTNRSLNKGGLKSTPLPHMVGVGRSLRCRESVFEAWLEGRSVEGGTDTAVSRKRDPEGCTATV